MKGLDLPKDSKLIFKRPQSRNGCQHPSANSCILEKDTPLQLPPSAGGPPGGRPEINSVQGSGSTADLLLDLTQDHESLDHEFQFRVHCV